MHTERRSLVAAITVRAKTTYYGEVTLETFPQWERHWLNTARQWRTELVALGEHEAVAQIDRILEWNEQNRQLLKLASMKR